MEPILAQCVNLEVNATVSRPVLHFAVACVVINLLLWGVGGALQVLSARRVQSQEAILRDELRLLRKSIDQFSADLERAPASLDELVREHYIREVPRDPMTGSSDTWVLVFEADPIALDGKPGVIDVKSASTRVDGHGQRRYSEW